MKYKVIHGDCLDVMKTLPENCVDAIVTDPPYGIDFMSRHWDRGIPGEAFWREALRISKPGVQLIAFGGTRMFHRLACAIEEAGWELRDTIGHLHHGECPWLMGWVFGSGFPKGVDVSKAIDKHFGAERKVVGQTDGGLHRGRGATVGSFTGQHAITAPATEEAKTWDGWNVALKPAWEPIVFARKPLDGTIAENVLKHGVGAINVDACKVGIEIVSTNGRGGQSGATPIVPQSDDYIGKTSRGRWPSNLVHDQSPEVRKMFPLEGGSSVSRFFYSGKATREDRDEGLELFERSRTGSMCATADGSMLTGSGNVRETVRANIHPTVKPTNLMRYFCRLVTPPGGVVLDMFMGSGSTGKAAMLEGFRFLGIEREADFLEIAKARIEAARQKKLRMTSTTEG